MAAKLMNTRAVKPSDEVAGEVLQRATSLADGLFPHQVEGLAFLLGRRRAILADDMGLGKTRQSIVAMREAAPEGPWLVVCPASVKRNWQREIDAALGGSQEVAVIGDRTVPPVGYRGWVAVNYDLLKKHIDSLLALPWAGLIFDEAHYLKNHTSQRSKRGTELVASAPGEPAVHCAGLRARRHVGRTRPSPPRGREGPRDQRAHPLVAHRTTGHDPSRPHRRLRPLPGHRAAGVTTTVREQSTLFLR